jgi:hypothetical protein
MVVAAALMPARALAEQRDRGSVADTALAVEPAAASEIAPITVRPTSRRPGSETSRR